MLKAPQSAHDSDQDFLYQVCVSGSTDKEPFRSILQRSTRASNDERIAMIRGIAPSFSEPFCSFLLLAPSDTSVKQLDLDDWALPNESSPAGLHTLVGDAAHAMTMCKSQAGGPVSHVLTPCVVLGAGANHAIVDVLELKRMVLSQFSSPSSTLQTSIEEYQRSVALRTLPTVLASRQACLEAHDWAALTSKSQLLSARQMVVDFDQ